MSTMADYRAGVRARGYDGQSDATLNELIRDARNDILDKRRWSYTLAQNLALATVAGVDTVSLAPITDLVAIDAIRYRSGTTQYDLDPVDLQVLRDRQTNDATTARGLPSIWARIGASVVFYPTPQAVYVLAIDYVRGGELPEDTEDYIPDVDRELVVWSAVMNLAFRQREAWAMQYADQRCTALLRSALDRDQKTARSDSDQVQPYWRSGDRYAG